MSPTDPRNNDRPEASSWTIASAPRAALGPPAGAAGAPALRPPPAARRRRMRCVEVALKSPDCIRCQDCVRPDASSRSSMRGGVVAAPDPRPLAGVVVGGAPWAPCAPESGWLGAGAAPAARPPRAAGTESTWYTTQRESEENDASWALGTSMSWLVSRFFRWSAGRESAGSVFAYRSV